MKKTFFVLGCLLAVGFASVSCNDRDDDDEVVISETQLPANAKTFLATHFSNATISRIEKNNTPDADGTMYEVKLSNGFQVDFDTNGEWTGVDAPVLGVVPASVLSLVSNYSLINTYISSQYSNFKVTEIEKKANGFQIEINYSIDLVFDNQGKFVRISY